MATTTFVFKLDILYYTKYTVEQMNNNNNNNKNVIRHILDNDYVALEALLPGIDVNQQIEITYRGTGFRVLLGLACYMNDANVVKLLLAIPNIDVNSENMWASHRPLYIAIRYNKLEALKELVKHASLNVNNDMYLHHTIESNNILAFSLLLAHTRVNLQLNIDGLQGEDDIVLLSTIGSHDETALDLACRLDRQAMVKALVAFGAEITSGASSYHLLRGLGELRFDIKLKWRLEFTDPRMYAAAASYLTLLAMRSNLIQLKKFGCTDTENTNKKTDEKSQKDYGQDTVSRFWLILQQLSDDTAQKLLLTQTGDSRIMIPKLYLSEQYNINYLPATPSY